MKDPYSYKLLGTHFWWKKKITREKFRGKLSKQKERPSGRLGEESEDNRDQGLPSGQLHTEQGGGKKGRRACQQRTTTLRGGQDPKTSRENILTRHGPTPISNLNEVEEKMNF